MKLFELAEKLGLEAVVVADENREVTGCYIGDLLSWVMSRAEEGDLWLTIMGNVNVIAVAKLTEVSAVVVCENAPIDEETLKRAGENGVPLYKTNKTIFQLAGAVSQIMN